MTRLHYAKAHRADQFADELFAALPDLIVPDPYLGRQSRATIESRDDDLWVTVPDDVSEAAVAAVVDAHAPRPRGGSPPADLVRPIVTGSRSDGTALASLLRRLEQAGIIEDRTQP